MLRPHRVVSPSKGSVTRTSTLRFPSRGEELANSISHGAGVALAAAMAVLLLLAAARDGSASRVVGVAVFGATAVLVYLTSTLYHALRPSPAKRVFQILDHGAIFLLIAGTYTPFLLGVLRGPWGWSLLAVVWTLAAAGVVLTAVRHARFARVSTAVYLAMAWLIVVAARPLWTHMLHGGIVWLLAGGAAYSGGVAFYAAKRVRYAHLVWHLCVIAGTACHAVAVWRYAA